MQFLSSDILRRMNLWERRVNAHFLRGVPSNRTIKKTKKKCIKAQTAVRDISRRTGELLRHTVKVYVKEHLQKWQKLEVMIWKITNTCSNYVSRETGFPEAYSKYPNKSDWQRENVDMGCRGIIKSQEVSFVCVNVTLDPDLFNATGPAGRSRCEPEGMKINRSETGLMEEV